VFRRLNTPTAICVPRIALVGQYEEVAQKWGTSATGYYCARKEISKLTIFVYDSARLHREEIDQFLLVIFDEAHHLASPQNSHLLENVEGKYLLGLTATPVQKSVLPVVYNLSGSEAKELNIIAPLKIESVYSELSDDERAKYNQYTRAILSVSK